MPMIFDFNEWLETETLTREEADTLIKAIRTRESQGPWSISMSGDEKKMFVRRDGPTAYVGSKKSATLFINLIEANIKMQEVANDTTQDDGKQAA